MKDLTYINWHNSIYILIPIFVLVILIMGYRKKVRIASFFKVTYPTTQRILAIGLITLGLILSVIALIGPTKALADTEVKSSGLDIYVLLDTSKSMLSEDVPPSRLDRGKAIVEGILDGLDGDRIGYVPFASSAYVQMPLTDDVDLARMFLDVVDTDMISGGGSNVAKGLQVAMDSFDESATGDKVIIILSDGEEHDDQTKAVIDQLKKDDVRVFSVGIGTLDGGLIPEMSADGKQIIGYKKDSNGETILTKLNEALLVSLANGTGGNYYRESSTPNASGMIVQDLSYLEDSIRGVKKIKNYEHLYQYFLATGLLLIISGWIIIERGGIREKMVDSASTF